MRNRDKILSIIVVIILIYIVANVGAINTLLMSVTEPTVKADHTTIAIPEAWNSTVDMGMTKDVKSPTSITNGYVVWDIFEDWPEDKITDISRDKLSAMEQGGYDVLNSTSVNLGGTNVSKEYFRNPSRDTDTVWDCVGVTYVFPKEDCNYAIQIHYFTKSDYNNASYKKELDDRVEDLKANMHNWHFDGFFSNIAKVRYLFGGS